MPNRCFCPECKSGYSDTKKKVYPKDYTMFHVPKDPAVLSIWNRAIPRADKVLTAQDHVCSKHFLESDIVYYEQLKLKDGTIWKNKLFRPRLKKGAIPRLFPNLPAIFSFNRRSDTTPHKKASKKSKTLHDDNSTQISEQEGQSASSFIGLEGTSTKRKVLYETNTSNTISKQECQPASSSIGVKPKRRSGKRPKKRKFNGNRYTRKKSKMENMELNASDSEGKLEEEIYNTSNLVGKVETHDMHTGEEPLNTINLVMKVETHDMHTGGEPLRIVVSGLPEIKGSTVLEKRDYIKTHLDDYRKLLMNEPRGHKDMYGVIIDQKEPHSAEIDAIFINNEGYGSMCGHAVIALGRYVIDKGLVEPCSPVTEVTFNCPCGPVKTKIEYSNGLCGQVTFQSVPAFVYKLGQLITIPKFGLVKVDISFGGAFYALVKDEDIGLNLKTSPLNDIIKFASLITESVKKQIPIIHPKEKDLSFFYGTIVTDSNVSGPSTNVCVFADKEVDRSPTGSGVTARIALQFRKGLISLNEEKEFGSIIGSSFVGKAVKETTFFEYPAVIVEVSGVAYHTGAHTFYLEKDDPIGIGFQLDR